MILPQKKIFWKHQNKAEFKKMNDFEVPSCDLPGRSLNDLNSLNNLNGLNDLNSLISSKKY